MHLKLSGKETSNTSEASTQNNTSNQSHNDSDRNWNTSKIKSNTKDLASINALVHDDG